MNSIFDLFFDFNDKENKESFESILNKNTLDLKTKEGVDKAHESIDVVFDNPFFKAVLGEQLAYDMHNMVDDYHAKLLKEQENTNNENECEKCIDKKVCACDRKVIDKSEENKESFDLIRPSQDINVNTGLQIHRLVQEYIDTMVKPYAKGILTEKQINDAYAGLYEFACWIYNK